MAIVQNRAPYVPGEGVPGTLQSLFRTKSHPPPLPATCLSRPSVQAKLRSFQSRRATTVVGPAGAGKTTLLTEFANTSIGSVFWYTVDELDASDQRLLVGLSGALQLQLPIARGKLAHIAAIVDELSRHLDRRTLIVDDIHRLDAGSTIDALANLLRYLPGSFHVILAGRRIPEPLRAILDIFAGQRQLGELSWLDLELSDLERADATTLFSKSETSRWLLAWARPAELDLKQFIEREVLAPLAPEAGHCFGASPFCQASTSALPPR